MKIEITARLLSTGANIVDQDFFEGLGFSHYVASERLKAGLDDANPSHAAAHRGLDLLQQRLEEELRAGVQLLYEAHWAKLRAGAALYLAEGVIGAMKKELPVRHWPTLPETQLIPDLLADAPRRVQEMMRKAKENARPGT